MVQNKVPIDNSKLKKNIITISKDDQKLLDLVKTTKILEPSYIQNDPK